MGDGLWPGQRTHWLSAPRQGPGVPKGHDVRRIRLQPDRSLKPTRDRDAIGRAQDDPPPLARNRDGTMSLETRIRSLEETIRQVRERDAPPNEESAKNWVILPILKHLGWPGDDPEHVLFEHVVGKGRMDIALRTGGRMVAFIEAKAPGKSLGDHVTQMLNYAFLAGVDICVLTTGLEWWLFLPLEKVPPMDRRFAVLKIAKGSAREFAGQMLGFLGREALAGRDAERRAKEALTALRHEERLKKEVPRVWREMTAVADPELVELIRKRVNQKAGLQPTASQVASILGLAVPRSTNLHPVKPSPVGPPPEPETEPTKQRRAPAPIRSYRLWGSKTAVKTWKDMLVGVFVALHTRHEVEFLTTARSLWGKHRPWVSNDLGELHEPRIIGQTGLYAETHLSAKAIQRRCHRLLHAFGYPDGDLEVLQD